jgi:hypothetical protein
MEVSAKGGQAKPATANATGFNPWKFTRIGVFQSSIVNHKLKIHYGCCKENIKTG